jgi:hypothetical protein
MKRTTILVTTALVAVLTLVSGCQKQKSKELNEGLTWTDVHAEREYTDAVTAELWSDTMLPAPAFHMQLDLIAPSAKGSLADTADSLRTYLIRQHDLEGMVYWSGMSVQQYADSLISFRLGNYQEDLSRAKALMEQDGDSSALGISLFIDELILSDSLVYDHHGLISMKISQYAFIGGAHGNTTIRCATYDLKHNRPVTLDHLFVDGSADRVNQMLLDELMRSFEVDSPEALEEKGVYLVEEATMSDRFFLTEEGVTFFYNPYDIAAYFVGPIELTLPYESLRGCLADEYYKRLTTPL